jgi:general secretion pathway protein M
MEAFKAYWAARASRERMMLAGGMAAAIILFLYMLVWDPIQTSRARLATELPKLRAQAAQFRLDAEQAEALRGRIKSNDSGRPLPSVIDASAKAAGLRDSIKQIQSLSNDRSQINLTNVGFDTLVQWLAGLGASDGISVETMNASAASQSGRVQVESLVVRSARAQ